jgi:hypothetical protein
MRTVPSRQSALKACCKHTIELQKPDHYAYKLVVIRKHFPGRMEQAFGYATGVVAFSY